MKHVITLELRDYSPSYSTQGNSRIGNIHNFIKQTLTKFLESSDLELDDLLPFECYCYNTFSSSNGTESLFFLISRHNQAEGQVTYLSNCSRYYRNNKRNIILEELHKLWKHYTAHLKELHLRNENPTEQVVTIV